jgi:hypothetical protein
MQADDGAKVDLGEHVAVEHHDRLGELVAGVLDGAGRAEGCRLHDVTDLDAEVGAVAKDLLDAARLVVEAENDLVDLRNLLQEVNLIVQERPVENRNNRLRCVDGQGAQPSPFAPARRIAFMTNNHHTRW